MDDVQTYAGYGQTAQHGKTEKNNFTILHNELKENTEKLCLFASYNFTDEVAAYVLYYLSELNKEGFTIAFVTTSKLTEVSMGNLKSLCALVVERENKGIDFGSWKLGLEICNWAQNCNEVLIANDSVFGPFYNLGPIFSTENKRFDVWGMTDNYEIDYHLQSYFLHFNEQVIKSRTWLDFWQKMDFTDLSKDEIVKKYEVGLSQAFLKAGFTLGVYAPTDTINRSVGKIEKEFSPPLVHWKVLIEKFTFPFLKRELLIRPSINQAYWHKRIYINTSNWHQVIKQHTNYPVALIDDFLQAYFHNALQATPKLKVRKKKILFIAQSVEATDIQKQLLHFLKWLAKNNSIPFEVIIASSSERNSLYDEFASLCLVTEFWNLSEKERTEFRNRLITDSIGLIFSNDLGNVVVQQALSFLDAPQIVYVDQMPHDTGRSAIIENNKSWIKRDTAHFLASTDMVKERLKRYFKLDENRLSTVHKFVEVPKQPDSAESVWMLSHALNLPSNCFIIGVNGMFDGRISSDLILALAAMLCQQNRDIHIVWTNAETNGPTYEILDNDLRRAGISSQVHLIPQQVDADAYYALFDIFLLLSKEDTLPLVAIEVGLRGVPVICFENTAIATDYLTPGIGKAVPYLDITALHRTVLEYYTNKAQLKKEALSVVNAVKSRFLISIQAPKLYEIVNHYYNEQELVPVDEHPAITVITHLFYDTTWKEIKHKLVFFKDLNTRFLFSVSEACLIKDELVADIKGSFKDAHVLTTTNIGKDIGGKFALIDLYLTLGIQSDYIIFVHDKVSPHSIDGHSWKNNLQKIIDYKNYWQILAVFKQDDKIGVVGAIEHLINEYDRTNGTFINNSDRTHEFLKKYNITISNYDFIGGTMYWMKAPIIEKFFTKYHPLQIRSELEAGNVMDNHGSTNAHTWERVLSWIATNQGYKVYGI